MTHSSKLPFRPSLQSLCCRAVVLPLATIATSALAQDADDDDVVIMSPFVISESEDVGYMATNSTAGTSLNMLIRDIPLSLEVINREMIDDMQATTLEESLIYSAGVFTDNYQANNTATPGFVDRSPSNVGNYNDPFQNTISIRGYTVPSQQRAGFRVGFLHPTGNVVLGGSTDTITTERQEVVRGPQSLLYGINVMSGVTNIEPKRPLGDFTASTSVMVGADNEFRATIDVSDAAIQGKLNYRVLGATHRFDDHDQIDFREHSRDTIGVQFDWIISPRTTLFLEYIYAERETRGNGPQRFSTSTNLRDRYGEAFDFGEDDPTFPIWRRSVTEEDLYDFYEQNDDLSFLGFEGATSGPGPLVQNPLHSEYYNFEDQGRGFNISGPDTFKNQTESNFLAQLYHSFSDNLNMELGFYHSEVQIEERNLTLGHFWNSGDTSARLTPGPAPARSRNYHDWYMEPEVNPEIVENDWIGYHLGEMFIFDRDQTLIDPRGFYNYTFLPPVTASEAYNNPSLPVQRIFGYYNWYSKPVDSESNQFRVRLAYEHQTEWFGGETHTFVVGGNLIQDEINFISGNGVFEQFYTGVARPISNTAVYPGKQDQDPIYFRNSIFDLEPIRLRPGDNIPVAGNVSISRLGALQPSRNINNPNLSHIARSGHRNDKLWFRGAYAIYRGRFWDDRVTLITGIRHDSYQGSEAEKLLILDRDQVTDRYMGTGDFSHIPGSFIGYGDEPWVYDPSLPDSLNANVANSIDILRSTKRDVSGNITGNGTREHLFAQSQTYNTKSGGLTVKIIDPLSVYVAYAEGIFPNVGSRDGAYNPIEPEESESREIGLKFELFDKKISGSIAYWQIDRTNAVTTFRYAPRPAQYYGGPAETSDPASAAVFSPLNTYPEVTYGVSDTSSEPRGGLLNPGDSGASPYQSGRYLPLNYGIDIRYVELAMEQLGYPSPNYGSDSAQLSHFREVIPDFGANGEILWDIRSGSRPIRPAGASGSFQYMIVDYEKALKNADPETSVLKRAFELAMVNADVHGEPTDPTNVYSGEMVPYLGFGIMNYTFGGGDRDLNSASTFNYSGSPGPNVTYEEEGEGVDGQIIFTPTNNWQLVFNFSHQKRSVVNIHMVDPVGISPSGEMVNYGTEYDVWVYVLGRENFADPTRASTYNGASVKGIDLSYVPQESAGIITRYTFREGVLQGLMIGGGMRYESEVETATRFGGDRIAENDYLPPNRPERFVFNAFARYGWEMWDIGWRLQLNVDNIFDHDHDEVVTEYRGEFDTPIYRRTRVYYQPRTWRVALSAQF